MISGERQNATKNTTTLLQNLTGKLIPFYIQENAQAV